MNENEEVHLIHYIVSSMNTQESNTGNIDDYYKAVWYWWAGGLALWVLNDSSFSWTEFLAWAGTIVWPALYHSFRWDAQKLNETLATSTTVQWVIRFVNNIL
jgi:hypothetical protein